MFDAFVFFRVIKLPERAFTVGLFLVSLLEVEAAPKREFKAVLISQKFLFLDRQGKLQKRLLSTICSVSNVFSLK